MRLKYQANWYTYIDDNYNERKRRDGGNWIVSSKDIEEIFKLQAFMEANGIECECFEEDDYNDLWLLADDNETKNEIHNLYMEFKTAKKK